MILNKKRFSFAKCYFAALLVILLLQVLFCLSPSHQQKIEPVFLWPMAIALLSLALCQFYREGRLLWDLFPALGIVVWMYLSRALNGDPYLQLDLHFMLAVLLGFGVFYSAPFLPKRMALPRYFGILAKAMVCLLSAISCVALYCTFTGTSIGSPFADLQLSALQGRLFFFSMHPNEFACCLSIGFFFAICSSMDAKRLWAKLLWGLMALCLWLCVSATVTRTVMISISIGMGMLAFVLVLHALRKRGSLCKIGIATLSLLCAAVLCFGLFSFATSDLFIKSTAGAQDASTQAQADDTLEPADRKTLLEQRSLVKDMGTFTGRKAIWQAGLQELKARPITLLIGMTDAAVARIPNKYTERNAYHMHNAWLETLLLAGIPGLALYLCLMLRIAYCCIKLFFSEGAPLSQRALAIVPAILMINALMEIYPSYSGKLMDLLFFLVSGVVVILASPKSAAENEVSS
ncbi:MAG: O-antigen ligase family protein [Clostridia bacterium]